MSEATLLRRAEEFARTGGLNWSSLEKGFRKAVGCAKCGQLGYAGRDVIAEALEVTPEIAPSAMKTLVARSKRNWWDLHPH